MTQDRNRQQEWKKREGWSLTYMREMHNKDKIGELTQTLAELSIAERGEGIGTVSKNKTKVRVRC